MPIFGLFFLILLYFRNSESFPDTHVHVYVPPEQGGQVEISICYRDNFFHSFKEPPWKLEVIILIKRLFKLVGQIGKLNLQLRCPEVLKPQLIG